VYCILVHGMIVDGIIVYDSYSVLCYKCIIL